MQARPTTGWMQVWIAPLSRCWHQKLRRCVAPRGASEIQLDYFSHDAKKIRPVKARPLFFLSSLRLASGAPARFPDTLFQLGEFADFRDLFACSGELISLFGRTGNSRAAHWNRFAN
jgi:hypothetical protein